MSIETAKAEVVFLCAELEDGQSRQQQKNIRAKLRRRGHYGGIIDPYDVFDVIAIIPRPE